jgi:restriction system protein
MSWQQFEMLVGEAFRRRGFTVVEQGGGGADGGVDLVVSNGSERFLVQCKQWRAYKVGVTVVRELYGVMAAKGAVGGYVVTSGVFTQEARDFAQGLNIELIDGGALPVFLRANPQGAQVSAASRGAAAPAAPISAAACPKCGAEMVRRVARRGASAGKAFWGCTNYPACNGTREIAGP